MESHSPDGGIFSFPPPPPPFLQTLPTSSSSSSSSSSSPSCSSSHWISSSSLGFAGVGVAILLLSRSYSRFKPLSTAIKLTDGVVHVFKALYLLQSPSPQSFLFASKAVVKGYKISKRLCPSAAAIAPRIPRHAAKQLKAFVGVVNLVKYATYPFLGDGRFEFLKSGYKLSKNFVKVLEGFVGLQLDSALREGIDALGLLVKATFVWRELGQWIATLSSSNNRLDYTLLVGADLRYKICLSCKKSNFDYHCALANIFPEKKPPLLDEPVNCEIVPLELYISELLSLAIPLHEEQGRNISDKKS